MGAMMPQRLACEASAPASSGTPQQIHQSPERARLSELARRLEELRRRRGAEYRVDETFELHTQVFPAHRVLGMTEDDLGFAMKLLAVLERDVDKRRMRRLALHCFELYERDGLHHRWIAHARIDEIRRDHAI